MTVLLSMLGLYLHIPFCQAICSYCNFNRGLLDPNLKRRYVDALESEIRESPTIPRLAGPPPRSRRSGARGLAILAPAAGAQQSEAPTADTIFFGGGTPSLLDPEEVRRLIDACRDTHVVADAAEITLETNPETATPERLAGFRDAGVNRLSFGVQSFDDGELHRLGRLHSSERARAAVRDAKRTGFRSVSLDLMFWLPGQSSASWARTIDDAVALDPDHLSLYLLELYPNAPLKEAMARATDRSSVAPDPSASSAWAQAADDEAADMYLDALSRLDEAGYEQYEISNVAKPGHQSRHNLKYWQSGDWRGFGCGAHSTVDGVRWKNLASTGDYVDRIAKNAPVAIERTVLTPQARCEEALFTGLRLAVGVNRQHILSTHGVDPWSHYAEQLAPFEASGLLWAKDDRFGLSRPGMLLANEILSIFV
jgi:oxygen-independent coproporphyrinogen III oxidase